MYEAGEGDGTVEVCAILVEGGLERDVEVDLFSQSGSASSQWWHI